MKLKPCPFCGKKAVLREPKRLRTNHSALMSDISYVDNCVTMANYWPWDKDGKEFPREKQTEMVVKNWNTRK